MEFKDKLIELRKKKGISQEGLAEELGVTRQTVSKWELGQTKPDMDKLLALSKYYGVGVEELTLDTNIKSKEDNYTNSQENASSEKNKSNKTIWILAILLGVIIIGIIGYSCMSLAKTKVQNVGNDIISQINGGMPESDKGIVSAILDFFKKLFNIAENQIEDMNKVNNSNEKIENIKDMIYNEATTMFNNNKEKQDVSQFNFKFTNAEGSKSKFFLQYILDDVVTSNETNDEHKIYVVFNGKETADSSEIKEIKNGLENFPVQYEVDVQYDEAGYVYKIEICQWGRRKLTRITNQSKDKDHCRIWSMTFA